MVIVDTNIIIDHLRQTRSLDTALERFMEIVEEDISLSVLSIQELFAGKSSRLNQNRERILEVLSLFEIIPYSFEIAKTAGMLVRDLRNPIEFPDAAIAATALVYESSLLTLNHKDFAHIPGLRVYKLD